MKNVKGDHVKLKQKKKLICEKQKNMWRPNSRSHVHFVSLLIFFSIMLGFTFNILYSENPTPGYIHSTSIPLLRRKKTELQEQHPLKLFFDCNCLTRNDLAGSEKV